MSPTKKFSIAIIDDDNISQFIAKKAVERVGIFLNILSFYNGLEAIDYLDNCSVNEALPDVILLDLNMPIMDGWGFLNHFVERKPKLKKAIKIFIVSSSVSEDDMLKAKSFNEVSIYLVKPLTAHKLNEAISIHLLKVPS